jgi:hypothetical protein
MSARWSGVKYSSTSTAVACSTCRSAGAPGGMSAAELEAAVGGD